MGLAMTRLIGVIIVIDVRVDSCSDFLNAGRLSADIGWVAELCVAMANLT
jgi:hypothetical protein